MKFFAASGETLGARPVSHPHSGDCSGPDGDHSLCIAETESRWSDASVFLSFIFLTWLDNSSGPRPPYYRGSQSHSMGLDSSVGIATCYGVEGPGIESRWG